MFSVKLFDKQFEALRRPTSDGTFLSHFGESFRNPYVRRLFEIQPTTSKTTLSTEDCKYVYRFLLHLNPSLDNCHITKCVCNKPFTPDHAMCCPKLKSGYRIRRHDAINHCLFELTKSIGVETFHLEPKLGLTESRLRPDFRFWLIDQGKDELADGVCIHTLVKSRSKMTIKQQFDNIDTQKFTKYYQNPEINRSKLPFTTFCSTSFGLLSPDSYNLITRIINSNEREDYLRAMGVSREDYHRMAFVEFIDQLLITIHRGNAGILRSAVQQCLQPSSFSLLHHLMADTSPPMVSDDGDAEDWDS